MCLQVTLVVPWLPLEDQRLIFPYGITCKTKEEQAAYIRQWAGDNSCDSSDGASSSSSDFDIVFYDARYYPKSRCIFATEDIMKIVPKEVRGNGVYVSQWQQHSEPLLRGWQMASCCLRSMTSSDTSLAQHVRLEC